MSIACAPGTTWTKRTHASPLCADTTAPKTTSSANTPRISHFNRCIRYSLFVSPRRKLRTFLPLIQIMHLFGGENINVHTHRFELEASDFAVNFFRNGIDVRSQAGEILNHEFCTQRLIGEAHIHHARGMTFRRGEV